MQIKKIYLGLYLLTLIAILIGCGNGRPEENTAPEILVFGESVSISEDESEELYRESSQETKQKEIDKPVHEINEKSESVIDSGRKDGGNVDGLVEAIEGSLRPKKTKETQETEVPNEPEVPIASKEPEKSAAPEVNPSPVDIPIPTKEPVETEAPILHTHNFEKLYWYGEPTCSTTKNYYTIQCTVCGEYGGDGNEEVPHTVKTDIRDSKEGCALYRITESECSVCGTYLGRTAEKIGESHRWISGQGDSVWDEEKQSFVVLTLEYCMDCYKEK